jgi:hypothetical protein
MAVPAENTAPATLFCCFYFSLEFVHAFTFLRVLSMRNEPLGVDRISSDSLPVSILTHTPNLSWSAMRVTLIGPHSNPNFVSVILNATRLLL